MQLSTRDEQLDVLAKVLAAGEEEAGVEVADITDDVTRTKRALAQRTTGNLAKLSGADGLTYMEVCAWPQSSVVYGAVNPLQSWRSVVRSATERHVNSIGSGRVSMSVCLQL